MTHQATAALKPADEARKRRIEILARATEAELTAALAGLGDIPKASAVRGPETGLIMIRGRMGGTGSVFNLGEATVTRATVRLESGAIGHGQCLGGDKTSARISAHLDALATLPEFEQPMATFVDRIEARLTTEDTKRADETAATRVDFFTMVRGDD